jgi:pimeloyl-ACP methyl ester carboxylesterase
MIAVHDLGGVGEPLLVCHATGFCGHMYEPFARTLGTRLHVFAVDLRGHGDSPLWPGASFDWPDITADVLDAAHRIRGRIHLSGHSLGGAVALAAAVAEPDRFTSVFLFETNRATDQGARAGGAEPNGRFGEETHGSLHQPSRGTRKF